jgi:hypothetical protein
MADLGLAGCGGAAERRAILSGRRGRAGVDQCGVAGSSGAAMNVNHSLSFPLQCH